MDKLLLIIKLLPVLIQAIKALESAIPGTGAGEQKLALLRGLLETVDGSISANWGSIESVIAMLVKTFNKTGWGQ
jgi:hypothetical protein